MTKFEEALKAWRDKYPEPKKVLSAPVTCPPPMRHSQDEYRCSQCSMIWAVDEEKPTCNNPNPHP